MFQKSKLRLKNNNKMTLFPTCQVRVDRFYQSCPRPPPPPPPPPRQLQIAVGTAGLHLPAPDHSGHCRTSSASSRAQWALPDLNHERQIAVGTAGPQRRLPDRSGHCRTSVAPARSLGTAECQNICQIECQNICQIECQIECQNMSDRMPEHMFFKFQIWIFLRVCSNRQGKKRQYC